jgi:hypothetical protein
MEETRVNGEIKILIWRCNAVFQIADKIFKPPRHKDTKKSRLTSCFRGDFWLRPWPAWGFGREGSSVFGQTINQSQNDYSNDLMILTSIILTFKKELNSYENF